MAEVHGVKIAIMNGEDIEEFLSENIMLIMNSKEVLKEIMILRLSIIMKCMRDKMGIAPAAELTNLISRISFMLTMIMRPRKLEVFYALSAIPALVISNIPLRDLNMPLPIWRSSRSEDKKLHDNKMKYLPVPVVFGTGQGRSANFGYAQSNQTQDYDVSFFVYRVANYQVVSIDNELLEATRDNAGAFVDQAKLRMDTGFRNITNDLAFDLFGDGSGVRGVISSISTGVITLVNAASVVQFEKGMSLIAFDSTNANQSTANAVGYIIAVNRSAGTVTVAATQGGVAATPTNWSTSFPNLLVQGDAVAGQTSMLKVSGLGAWFPFTTPASNDSFWGVNRSQDPTRLAGVKLQSCPVKRELLAA